MTLGLLLMALPLHAHAATPGPDATCTAFYGWYLGELAASREPVLSGKKVLASYIAPRWLASIERASHAEGGIDVDPFLLAQDTQDDWQTSISTSSPTMKGHTARVTVTLGKTEPTRWQLDVTLEQIAGTWRLAKVRRVGAQGSW
ncbi:MAG: DUF3828 domain-containing protein [Polyangia bacterium]